MPDQHDASIREMVSTIRSGGGLVSSMDEKDLMRLHLAVVRYVNGLGPGDVEEEFDRVCAAMGVIR